MPNTFAIPITSSRLAHPQADNTADEVRELVQLIQCPIHYYNHILENRHPHETIKQTFERTEAFIEERTGLRHYSSYEAFRVQKHRIQAAQGIGRQPTLFD